ncbi:MAG: hypothetical protein AAF702_50530 [Chloroflexota bacterium]
MDNIKEHIPPLNWNLDKKPHRVFFRRIEPPIISLALKHSPFSLREFEVDYSQARKDITVALAELAEYQGISWHDEIRIYGYCPIVDQFGALHLVPVVVLRFTDLRLDRINFDRFDSRNIFSVANKCWTHGSYEDNLAYSCRAATTTLEEIGILWE